MLREGKRVKRWPACKLRKDTHINTINAYERSICYSFWAQHSCFSCGVMGDGGVNQMRRVGGQLNAETDGAVEVCEKKWCMAKTNVLLSWLCIQAFSSASTSCPRSAKGLYEETLGEHSKQPLQGDGSS